MNKSEITGNLFKKNKILSKEDVEDSVTLIIENLTNALSDGDRVELRGFGTFSTRRRNKRISRNPKTGKSISIQQKFHPYFRASKNLKKIINN
jgi:integration host factor subunit beta